MNIVDKDRNYDKINLNIVEDWIIVVVTVFWDLNIMKDAKSIRETKRCET